MHDVPSIYRVPVMLDEQKILDFFIQRLELTNVVLGRPRKLLSKWRDLADRFDHMTREVKIALVGKYTRLEDAYASVVKSLKHSSLHLNHRLKVMFIEATNLEPETEEKDPVKYHEAWQQLCSADGILVPGGFGDRGIEGKISAIEWARKQKKPFLGVCLGLQCAVIEFARNVLNVKDAHTTEVNPKTPNPFVVDMPEHTGGDMGATMRLGKRKTFFNTEDSVLFKLYGSKKVIEERHRHRYEVNPEKVSDLEAKGLRVVAKDDSGKRMEIIEVKDHPYFVAVQFHPEYLSRPLKPSPPYLGLILASIGKLNSYLAKGCRVSPRQFDDDDCSDLDGEMAELSLKPPSSLSSNQSDSWYTWSRSDSYFTFMTDDDNSINLLLPLKNK